MDEMYDSFRSLHSMQGDLHQRRLLCYNYSFSETADRIAAHILQNFYSRITASSFSQETYEKDDQMHIL